MLAFFQIVCACVRFKAEEKTEEILKVFREIRVMEGAGRKSQKDGTKRLGQGINLEKEGFTARHAGPLAAAWGAGGEREGRKSGQEGRLQNYFGCEAGLLSRVPQELWQMED